MKVSNKTTKKLSVSGGCLGADCVDAMLGEVRVIFGSF
jgi:hypothetical protein